MSINTLAKTTKIVSKIFGILRKKPYVRGMKDVRDIGNNRVISQLVDNQSVRKMWITFLKITTKCLVVSLILRIFTYIKQLKGMSCQTAYRLLVD